MGGISETKGGNGESGADRALPTTLLPQLLESHQGRQIPLCPKSRELEKVFFSLPITEPELASICLV